MYSSKQVKSAVQVLQAFTGSIDRTPYTSDFERLHAQMQTRLGASIEPNHCWKLFLYVRKKGYLGRKPKDNAQHG